ncbi:hypothetical protein M8J77_021094 [Diaphorina citri]|nr:hypothetical protein M8J77_021094 [Diaphorina citri]
MRLDLAKCLAYLQFELHIPILNIIIMIIIIININIIIMIIIINIIIIIMIIIIININIIIIIKAGDNCVLYLEVQVESSDVMCVQRKFHCAI